MPDSNGLKEKLVTRKRLPRDGALPVVHEDIRMPMWALNAIYFVHEGARMLLLRFMTAYFTRLKLDTRLVGVLQVLGTTAAFCGEITWASVSDSKYGFKRTALCCNAFGVVFFMCIPLVKSNFTALCCVYALASFGLNWVGIRDAFAVLTLEAMSNTAEEGASKFGRVRKFAALGWGTCGLITGILEDNFGEVGVFGLFFSMELTLLIITLLFVKNQPEQPKQAAEGLMRHKSVMDMTTQREGGLWGVLKEKHTIVFFANILFYGVCTALQEVYEFVYLLRGFEGANSTLLGLTLVVMTLSELPVFHYADKLIRSGFVTVYTACQLLMATRCLLYSFLPYDMPWLVLAIEPFHGTTFAAMWATSVEYARREAPKGCRSRLQALVSGTYFQVSQAVGSLMWGFIIHEINFRPSYQACAFALFVWSLVWNLAVQQLGDCPLHRSNARERDAGTCTLCLPPTERFKRMRTGMFYAQMTPIYKRIQFPSSSGFLSKSPSQSPTPTDLGLNSPAQSNSPNSPQRGAWNHATGNL